MFSNNYSSVQIQVEKREEELTKCDQFAAELVTKADMFKETAQKVKKTPFLEPTDFVQSLDKSGHITYGVYDPKWRSSNNFFSVPKMFSTKTQHAIFGGSGRTRNIFPQMKKYLIPASTS